MREVVEEAGRCELCGSRRNLEAHHIIPYCIYKQETKDNLICVCRSCHLKLTPHSLLTKYGIQKARVTNAENELKCRIFTLIQEKIEEYGYVNYDIFYEAIKEA